MNIMNSMNTKNRREHKGHKRTSQKSHVKMNMKVDRMVGVGFSLLRLTVRTDKSDKSRQQIRVNGQHRSTKHLSEGHVGSCQFAVE